MTPQAKRIFASPSTCVTKSIYLYIYWYCNPYLFVFTLKLSEYVIWRDEDYILRQNKFTMTTYRWLSFLQVTIYIIIIIIIMSCRQHGYPWPSLATSPNHWSPPAGLQGYILCPHIVAVCKFELVVLLLHGHMWGSIGVHPLRARPYFSSSVPRVWFV